MHSCRVKYINFLMGDVQVSRKNHRLFFLESFEISCEISVPFINAIFDSFQLIARIRNVHRNQIEFFILSRQNSAFGIMFWNLDAIHDLDRLNLGEESDAGVAALGVAAVPVLFVPVRNYQVEFLSCNSIQISFCFI